MRSFVWCSLITLLICAELQAQDVTTPASRAEEIQNEQSAKAQTLSPDKPNRGEQQFESAENDARHILQGPKVHLQFGGLPLPASFAVGPRVQWQTPNDKARTSVWAIGSIHQFYGVGTSLEIPRITNERMDVTFTAAHMDLPRLDFYGEGPKSLKSSRTDYRREDTRFNINVAWPDWNHLKPRCKAEQLLLNVGPGTNDAVTSMDRRYTEAQAPGIQTQSNYFIAGCGMRLDFLDLPAFPHKGTAVVLDYHEFVAEQRPVNSFSRATASIQEYVPFFNKTRVIALHAAADMTFHNRDQVVPFYMQPTLGSYKDLRGFRALRFYDENAVAANVEYRWEICTGFDMAVFGDAGEVFHRPSQFSTSYIKSDVGFGLRFNDQRNMVGRLDIGFSHEGFHVWLVFDKVF